MRATFVEDIPVDLLNFAPVEQQGFSRAVAAVGAALGGKQSFPQLKSEVIYVVRNPYDHPRYLTEPPFELITVNAGENFPFQFLYQFAHELGHLMAQAGRRIGQAHRHCWIEEAICGAYSVHCMRTASQNGADWFPIGAADYLTDYINPTYGRPEIIDAKWYQDNLSHLQSAGQLTDKIKLLSWLIANELNAGEFILDNVAIIDTPLSPSVQTYLDEWERRCSVQKNVPRLLRERLHIS